MPLMIPIAPVLTLLAASPQAAPAAEQPPAFVDVAAARGIVSDNAPRPEFIDIDGDGWLDVVIVGKPLRILFSRPAPDGGRTFVEGTKGTRLDDREHSLLLWGDINGDGKLDAISVVTQTADQYKKDPQTYAVYLSDGQGHFKRQRSCGLEQKAHVATMGAVLTDLDLDGRLDVAFGNQYDGDSLEAQPMRVFRGNGKGRFDDVTKAWGFPIRTVEPGAAHSPRPLYGLTAADVDNDGYPELLGAAYGRQWNTLWHRTPATPFYDDFAENYGIDGDAIRHGRYSDAVKASQKKQNIDREDELPFRSGGNNFALIPADFDNDGDLDIFCAAITHWWAGESSDLSCLLVNTLETRKVPFFDRQIETLTEPDPETGRHDRPGRGLARDHDRQTKINWNQGDIEAHWADFDNDGLLDLLICESDYPQNHLRLFLQKPDHTFVESDRDLGLYWPNCPSVGLGDYNNDGKIDILAFGNTNRWPEARPKPAVALYENHLAPSENGWLSVRVVGDGRDTNTSGFGAHVLLTTSDGRTQMREVSGPYGHWAAQTEPGLVHFGLGKATPTSLTVIWPNAKRSRTVMTTLSRNTSLIIRQESAEKQP